MNPSQGIYGETGAALVNRCYILHTIIFSSFIEISHTNMKAYRVAKTNFRYDVFTTLLVSALPSSVKSSLPVLLLACPSLSKKKNK